MGLTYHLKISPVNSTMLEAYIDEISGWYFNHNGSYWLPSACNRKGYKNIFSQIRSHIRFAEEQFLCFYQPQIQAELLRNYGYHWCCVYPIKNLKLRTQLFVWASYGHFCFSHFNLHISINTACIAIQ